MAGDTESVNAIIERHTKKAEQYRERVQARAQVRRQNQREQRLYNKAQRAKDDKLGTTEDLLAGAAKGVDMADPKEHCLNQERVDHLRGQVTMRTLIEGYRRGDLENIPQQYLWFDRDDIRAPSLREGNPPADPDRPKHLQRLQLVLDYHRAPSFLKELCRETARNLDKLHHKNVKGDPIKRALQDDQLLASVLKRKLGIARG